MCHPNPLSSALLLLPLRWAPSSRSRSSAVSRWRRSGRRWPTFSSRRATNSRAPTSAPPTVRRGCRPSAPTISGFARSSGPAPTTPPPTRSASASSLAPSPNARTAPSTASSSTAPASSTSASRRTDASATASSSATPSTSSSKTSKTRFLAETEKEIVVLEIRTEFGHNDPPDFDKYLSEQLGEFLIPQDEAVFGKTVAEVLPRRVICVWKPRKSPAPKPGDPLWSSGYLRDNWIDTDLPKTKFDSNMSHLGEQPSVSERRYFYRVENTVTPQADNPVVCVRPVTERIHAYARLFISQAYAKGIGDRLQVFSTDFIDDDFVDACVALTHARIEGKA